MNMANESHAILKNTEAKKSKGLAWQMEEFEPEHLAKWNISSMSEYFVELEKPG